MSPTKIMVIRHAEKPNGDPGLSTPDGPGKFASSLLAEPQTLFASAKSQATKSLRPEQTITPLSNALPLPIDTEHTKGGEAGLVDAAKKVGGTVLIAWQHEAIPKIAELIRGGVKDIPLEWPDDRFDLVWVFDLDDGGKWSFAQVPQLLLRGDSPAPIPAN
jgi:hypothetical protein